MERGLKSAEAYRATALLCRQQAACDPDNRWKLLGEAERWEHLAEQILVSRQKDRMAVHTNEPAMTDVPPSPSKTTRALPPKSSRFR
jgi:hypothetical protein